MIDVYQFMEMCGLICAYKENVRISHTIMLKKLYIRYNSFPLAIDYPETVSFASIKKEDILTGRIVLVMDDYKKVVPYRRPMKNTYKMEETVSFDDIPEYVDEEEYHLLKPGEIKYISRHYKDEEEVSEIDFDEYDEYDSYVHSNRPTQRKLYKGRRIG